MKLFVAMLAGILLLAGCQPSSEKKELNLIPYPVELTEGSGAFDLSGNLEHAIKIGDADEALITYLIDIVKTEQGLELSTCEQGKIQFEINSELQLPKEGYQLSVTPKGVSITANERVGLFYAIQTLRQLIQVDEKGKAIIPVVEITDHPRFAWRGMHFDVSRHVFSVAEVKKFIDYLAMNKLNTMHWHLVDDQGWRLEIKKYPKLTEVGAWRDKVGFEANQKKGLNTDDGKPYGGFYTQEQVKEVVAYASERHITIVPEIELPGHSAAALVAYPEYYCDNAGDLEIWSQAGVSAGVYCAGEESTFQFLEDVLAETMELFPSEYIHIGGDETPKDTWLACPKCKKRMKDVNAHDEHELQSYFVSRIEKFLSKNGRRLIGWDEILDGGLAPNAAVMSWRGVAGGVKAAEAGHDVVMTPMFPYYFNHVQNHVPNAPGHPGISTLRDVYTFPSIPADISPENRKHIIGVQANIWTEYTPKFEHIEYNIFPRLFAISEVAWSPEIRAWEDFYGRVQSQFPILKKHGVNYGEISYHVGINVKPQYEANSAEIEFIAERPLPVYYTTDGREPTQTSTVYEGKFVLSQNAHIKACQFKPDGTTTNISEKEINFHKAFGKSYDLKYNHAPQYDGGGKFGLTNGFLGVWIGVEEKPVDVTIDLGVETEITKINSRFKNQPMSWVFGPKTITYSVSIDGKNFKEVATYKPGVTESDVNEIVTYPAEFSAERVRYVRILAESVGVCPAWHPAAGGKAWIFADEIIVE